MVQKDVSRERVGGGQSQEGGAGLALGPQSYALFMYLFIGVVAQKSLKHSVQYNILYIDVF